MEITAFDGTRWPVPIWPPAMPELDEILQRMLRDGTWSHYSGPALAELKSRLEEYNGTKHVHLCSSGTIATELALRAVGVVAGDEVILAAYDFPGNFRAIEAIGASPVLVDTVSENWTIDIEPVQLAYGPKVRAIVVSHLHGSLAPIREIKEWATARNVAVVEDVCQVPGAMIDGRRAGTWGDVGTLSFGGSKLLTAGRGGAVMTDDSRVSQRLTILNDRGNLAYPLSELQAAVLLPQVHQLDFWNAKRNFGAQRILGKLRTQDWFVQRPPSIEQYVNNGEFTSAYYKLPIWLTIPQRSLSSTSRSTGISGQGSITISQDGFGIEKFRANWINALISRGCPIGEGFRGFARRSPRRCRIVGELRNASLASSSTVLLSHPILTADEPLLDALADTLIATAEETLRAIS